MVTLNEERDEIKWTLDKKGVYTVKSFYRHLIENGVKYPHLYMWKIKMPPRIKVFMWLALRKSTLTKDNLIRRGWKGDDKCPFCGQKENINHLFLTCSVARLLWNILKCAFNLRDTPDTLDAVMKTWVNTFGKDEKSLVMIGVSAICWTIWKLRNSVIFDNNRVNDPCVPVTLFIKNLNDWNILQTNPARSKLMEAGVKLVSEVAEEIFKAAYGWRLKTGRIEG